MAGLLGVTLDAATSPPETTGTVPDEGAVSRWCDCSRHAQLFFGAVSYPGLVGEVRCFGCGALVPDHSGPAHGYMLSSPGCWALYGSVLAWRNALPGGDGTMAQRIVDTYAVQHATNRDRRNRQSVAVHLMSLCASVEHGTSGTRLQKLIGDWTHHDYPLLVPGPNGYPVTVRDVADAGQWSRRAIVDDWATSAWAAWSAHHDTVRAWLAQATQPGARRIKR